MEKSQCNEALFTKVVNELETVVRNADNGDCPLPLDRISMLVRFNDLSKPGCIVLACNTNQARLCLGDTQLGLKSPCFAQSSDGMCCSEDARTFEAMCEESILGYAAELLGIELVDYTGPHGEPCYNRSKLDAPVVAAKMLEIATTTTLCKKWVNVDVWDGDICAPDVVARLTKRFAAWLDGVCRHETFLNDLHRPSLASWNGNPWKASVIVERRCCGLGSDIPHDSVLMFDSTMDCGKTQKETGWSSSFIQLWNRKLVSLKKGGGIEERAGSGDVPVKQALEQGLLVQQEEDDKKRKRRAPAPRGGGDIDEKGGDDYELKLKKLKVSELRAACDAAGLSTVGLKAVLVSRLLVKHHDG